MCLLVLLIFTGKLLLWKVIYKKFDIMLYIVNVNCNDSKWNIIGIRVGE